MIFRLTIFILLLASCSGPQNGGLFSAKIPHEKYSDQLNKNGLHTTALGQQWTQAATKGLQRPLTVQLPYKETGYFDAAHPDAAGYHFIVRRGDKLVVELTQKPTNNLKLFLDLWQPADNGEPKLLMAPDSSLAGLQYEVKKDGACILRLQPELLAAMEYTLTIRTAPSLEFPVATTANPRIGSFWGDARDAGARKHEGIDIFGKFRTPVVAAADGQITSVTENNLGGKVVFMRPKGKDFVLYYAHLDSQMVQPGQSVQAGDVLGLIGNTGNARNTPPHLHFGIYTGGGAIDPFPFVNRLREEPPVISASLKNLNEWVRGDKGTVVQVTAAAGKNYKVKLPDATERFMASADISANVLKYQSITGPVYDKPDSTAAIKSTVSAKLPVLGAYKDYYYIKSDTLSGWIKKG
jgi:murein DD-endopeptidase MepM/ murein hydrolase activator NlpD